MEGTYDKTADAVYLQLVESIGLGGSKRQAVVEAEGLKAMMVLDFDDQDRILGIEIIGARGSLTAETLNSLQQIG
ncbi:MAG: DUF2283 domain-containing protein [Acidimicrobiia bacterium]